MKASDFLNPEKSRHFQLNFPDFIVPDSFEGLLNLHFSEVFCDEADITIGNLVIPEMTFELASEEERTELSEVSISLEMLLECSRTDITSELTALQNQFGKNICIAESYCGTWFVQWGTKLMCCLIQDGIITYAFNQCEVGEGVQSIALQETCTFENGLRDVYGWLHLYRTNGNHTRVYYASSITEEDKRIVDFRGESDLKSALSLGDEVRQNLAEQQIFSGTSDVYLDGELYAAYHYLMELQTSVYYEDGILTREILSGQKVRYEAESYGKFRIADTSLQDDDVLEVTAYGELSELEANIADFFTSRYISVGDTLKEVYMAFLGYLQTKKIANLTAARSQRLSNLSSLTVSGLPSESIIAAMTASRFLRELAYLEGGNARITRDGTLWLGWCRQSPVLTLTSNEMEQLRLYPYKVTAAQGTSLYDPVVFGETHHNLIQTDLEELEGMKLAVFGLLQASDIDKAFRNVIAAFSETGLMPFHGTVLAGMSPYLRAGETVRLISRRGVVAYGQVLTQELEAFPAPSGTIAATEGTTWDVEQVCFSSMILHHLEVSGYPEIVGVREPLDLLQLTVRAVQNNGDDFVVSNYTLHLDGDTKAPGIITGTVSYAGLTATFEIGVTSGAVLVSRNGEGFTAGNSCMVTKEY